MHQENHHEENSNEDTSVVVAAVSLSWCCNIGQLCGFTSRKDQLRWAGLPPMLRDLSPGNQM